MRTKSSPLMYFNFSGGSTLKVVQQYRAKYQAISELLEANPALLTRAHGDWAKLLSTSTQGRNGYTSEQLLRALLVMFVEQTSYRDTVVLIDNSEFLHYFVRLGVKPTMDYTFLNKAFGVLSPATLAEMNRVLADYAVQEGKIDGQKQRTCVR